MLHTPSYNMGLAAGTVAKDAGLVRPDTLDGIPGFLSILDKSEGMFFFPSSYVEGYFAAYDRDNAMFIDSVRVEG